MSSPKGDVADGLQAAHSASRAGMNDLHCNVYVLQQAAGALHALALHWHTLIYIHKCKHTHFAWQPPAFNCHLLFAFLLNFIYFLTPSASFTQRFGAEVAWNENI